MNDNSTPPHAGRGSPPLSSSLVFSSATYLTDFLLLGLMIAAARVLGPGDYGTFAFGLAFSSLLTFLTNPGLDSLLVNAVAQNPAIGPTTIGRVLGWKLLLTAGIVGLFVAALFLTIEQPLVRAVALVLTGAAVARSFNMTFRSILHAHERFDLETAVVASDRVLLFTVGLVTVLLTRDPLHLAAVFLCVRLVTLSWACWLVRRRVCRFRFDRNVDYMLKFQREALPYGIATLLFGVSIQVDTLLLGVLASSEDVGRFGASMKLYEGLISAAVIVNSVIYPRMSRQLTVRPADALRLYGTSTRYMMMVGGFVIAAGTLQADTLVELLFGAGYRGAAPLVMILLWAVAVRMQIATTFTLFRARRTQAPIMWLTAAGLAVRVVLNVALISRYGPLAAAAAVLASESLILVGALYFGHRLGHPIAGTLRTLPAVVLGAAGGGVLVASTMGGLPAAVQLGALGILYLAVLVATQAVRFDEIRAIGRTSEGVGG